MASMRDALKRLEIIYNECAPEAIAANAEEAALDDFTRLKKSIHHSVKHVREVCPATRKCNLCSNSRSATT